jgi:hypothetical protein
MMSLTETVIEGTILADGTLVLDQATQLPSGRVQVVVKSVSISPQPGLVENMDEVRLMQQKRGYRRRTVEEANAEEKARAEEDDDYDRRCEQLSGGPLIPKK